MQNNRNRLDFADAHTDFSTDAVTPLEYLIIKKLLPRVSIHIDLPHTLTGRHQSRNFIGLSFIMLVAPNN